MIASALEIIPPSMVETIQQAIDQININKFEIVAIQKFKNTNSFV